jgi:hypothetical protein
MVTQATLTVAVVAGALGLAVYAVPNLGPNWGYGDSDDSTPAAKESDEPLALPPGLDAPPGIPDVPVPGEGDGSDSSSSPSDNGKGGLEAMRDWAKSLTRVDVPTRALMAYGNAELLLSDAKPGCHLSWTTLAGLGAVESHHGSTGGTHLGDDGIPVKAIRGPALDGTHDNKLIKDTDAGQFDGDTKYDRAIGPLQFIPTTWERWQVDGDGDGTADPNDIDDAAVAAGYYLCADGRDLTTAEGWYSAIFSYNHKDSYVRNVYDNADAYGKASKTA